MSYRHLRIFAWICMACLVMSLVFKLKKNTAGFSTATNILGLAGELAVPLFLIADFSKLITNKNNIGSILKKYLIQTIALLIVSYAFILRYLYTLVNSFSKSFLFSFISSILNIFYIGSLVPTDAYSFLTMLFNSNISLATTLNIFNDMLLCTLAVYFMFAYPRKHFQGKKIFIFRLFVLFPILYETASVILKVYSTMSYEFAIPFYLFPLLTKKPPMMFAAFIAIVSFFKIRELIFFKKGKNVFDYDEFVKTKSNSMSFSIFASVDFTIAACIDFGLLCLLTIYTGNMYTEKIGSVSTETLFKIIEMVVKTGFGACLALFAIIPVLFLYNFSKEYENTLPDLIIPAVGILFCVIGFLESLVYVISYRDMSNVGTNTDISTQFIILKSCISCRLNI